MDTITLSFNTQPISTNNIYRSSRSGGIRYKTKEYKAFEKIVENHIKKLSFSWNKFETAFSPYDHCLLCSIVVEVPGGEFITKDGKVRSRRNDCDNWGKGILDAVFRHFEKLDDAYIVNLNIAKIPSKDEHWHTTISLFKENLDSILDNAKTKER
jgi:Holliday junction resolvase RusA-like endonuclease